MSDEGVILASPTGEEIGKMLFTEYDFEVGDFENTFLVTCLQSEWKDIEEKSRIYIPGTEYGGRYEHLETNTANKTIGVGGFTWRGMLQNHYIEPPPGEDYAVDSGEINAIIAQRVSAACPGFFVGTGESTGITVNYQYNRYVSVYDGLKEMLKSVGYKMEIKYDNELKAAKVGAVPIVDYSSRIEYSSDMNAHYYMTKEKCGVNHLICLGAGELRDRVVVHLYADAAWNISQTQTFFGADEICDIYDYAGASREDLINGGIQQMKQRGNNNSFRIDLQSAKEVDIGDIVGGRDYVTGQKMTSPITTKVVKWENGSQTIEYKLSDDVNVEQNAASLLGVTHREVDE